MAKRAIMRAPQVKIRYRDRAKRVVRRGVTAAARGAANEKHRIGAFVAAGALGFAEKQGVNLPHVQALGVAGTLGAICWAAEKFFHSRMAGHAATGLLSVQLYKWAKGDSVQGEDDMAGDLDD